MVEDLAEETGEVAVDADLAVVGAGPAGIVTALEAARRGMRVVLLESGRTTYDPAVQHLSEANQWDHDRHAPIELAVRRQVGGTSTIWGGRCVPYDPVDYAPRPYVGLAVWPTTYEQMQPYFPRACEWFVCGRPEFDMAKMDHLPPAIVPGLVDGEVRASSIERWSLPTDFGKQYLDQLRKDDRIRVLTGVTCTEVITGTETSRAERLACRTLRGGTVRVRAKAFVIACGGLESTRLLMSSESPQGGQLGNGAGELGRWYMAHAEGVVSNITFSTPPRSTVFGYERDIDGVYVRRRLTFTQEFQIANELPNIAGWIANPELPDAGHGSGLLSFVYLALDSPLGPKLAADAQRLSLTGVDIPGTPYGGSTRTSRRSHLRNIAREPLSTAKFMVEFGAKRFLARERRAPGFFAYSRDNSYPFQFHGEHMPQRASRVSLSDVRDELGRRKLDIDLRFSPQDIDGVVRAHQHWDSYLRKVGVGRLDYHSPDVHVEVAKRLGGGFHQIGTTRMSTSPRSGVVDENLAVHGVRNVFVVSSSTFVTSGQANSTFMIVAYALRLVEHLHHEVVAPVISGAG